MATIQDGSINEDSRNANFFPRENGHWRNGTSSQLEQARITTEQRRCCHKSIRDRGFFQVAPGGLES